MGRYRTDRIARRRRRRLIAEIREARPSAHAVARSRPAWIRRLLAIVARFLS